MNDSVSCSAPCHSSVSCFCNRAGVLYCTCVAPHGDWSRAERERQNAGDDSRALRSRSTYSIRSFDKGPALDELRLQRLEVLTRRVHLRLRIG